MENRGSCRWGPSLTAAHRVACVNDELCEESETGMFVSLCNAPANFMVHKKTDLTPAKHYVLDTNVLIHDPQSLFRFEDNVVWLPVEVLEELDRFKNESTTRGANAREVHRRLNERFSGA